MPRRQASPAVREPHPKQADICAICQDDIEEKDSNAWTTDCNHRFHATCLVQQLLLDPRCPCCRKPPRDYIYPEDLYDNDDNDDNDDDIGISPGITFKQAIKNVKSQAKNDKRLASQLKTVQKWKTIRKEAKRDGRKLASQLRPLEDKLEAELEVHNNKRWTAFETKHAQLISSHQEAYTLLNKANNQYHAARARVARKGGWCM
tara:strand:+ start:2946 stop:3557 length:612 start_codon:yes stop_codon:yes gene_type:complete